MPTPVSRTWKVIWSVRRSRLRPDADLAGLGELDRVGDEIAQDLGDLALIRHQRRQAAGLLEDESDVIADQQRAQHAAQRAEQIGGLELGRAHHRLAGLDLGDVEQIVDQLGQVLRRLADEIDLPLLLGRQLPVAARLQQARERQDRVERRAELMAHIGEEARFQLVGPAQMVGAVGELGVERDDAAIGVLQLLVHLLQPFLALPQLLQLQQIFLVLARDLRRRVEAVLLR